MNCETFHDHLLDLTSGRLEPAKVEVMLEHAAGCGECEAVLSIEEQFQADRRSGTPGSVPDALVEGMWPAVLARIGSRPRRSRGIMPSTRRVMTAVAALFLVAAGYLLGQVDVDRTRSTGPPVPDRTSVVAASARDGLVREVLDALGSVPDDRTLASPAEVEVALRNSPWLRRWAVQSRAAVDLTDGLQAGEVRIVLQQESGIVAEAVESRYLRRWLRQRV